MTLPSSLNMLTSSICAIGCTLSFLSDVCNFLSSVPELLCTFFTFRRGAPFPLFSEEVVSSGGEIHGRAFLKYLKTKRSRRNSGIGRE